MSELLFDLTLTDEQRMTRESVQRFAAAEMTAVARDSDEAAATPADFFERSLELGLALMPIPEALGGAGVARSPISNALNAEDLATGDMGMALGSITPLAFVNTLIDQGNQAQQEKYLPLFCGETFAAATIAFTEPRATFEPTQLHTAASRDGDSYVINGVKSMVPLGASAELIMVIAELEGEGPAAFIVAGDANGLASTAERNMGLRTLELATLTFTDVRVDADARLGESFDLQRFVDLSRIGICALAVGTGQAVLDYVVEYCNEREAFGEPITNRQSVAFMIADIAIELDAMRLMTWRAAATAERGEDFHEQAYLAKVFCAEHGMKIGTDGVQLLGGHGFCREHPVEMWYRNLRAIGILEGAASV
ncbi:oxidoreductase [Halieaceae bacterium IMCC14734]|uniref:Oxidoreductase n=1 Tax=Candidatus Litorirhabdus singularis TaxID=2518993 RepID=A0ABT3TL43_9GAMM|nr:acyl-CoA dehydrogenase family protein [Candidatus Litorirhabdus singularis]MCX2983033.1 oxidoreductase [Candidatus Litorirhabdus singularis]